MAQDAELARPVAYQPVPTHGATRVHADRPAPAHAWCDHEAHGGLAESRRLLPAKGESRLQPSPFAPKKHTKCPLPAQYGKPTVKTKSQKRKEKIFAALKPPYFILCMIAVMVCMHAWVSADVRASLEWSPEGWWQEPWRLLTYGVVHATNAHLALNAIVALAVGWRLECEQSWWRVCVLWACGVCAGALGAGALQPRVRVVGASAAVYALLCAHIPNVTLRFGHVPLWWFRPLSVVVLAASEACWALVRAAPAAPAGPAAGVGVGGATHVHDNVAWSAHVCGALVGLPLAFLLFTGENASRRHVSLCRVASAVSLVACSSLALVYYTCWTEIDKTI